MDPPADDNPGLAPTLTGTPGGVPPTSEVVPTVIGRYRIAGVLGHGAMGTVYAAHDPDLERRVALKVLRGGDSDAAKQRLLRDARAIARASHPAVVTVHEVGTAGGIDYIAMELIDGGNLQDWIRTAAPTQVEIVTAYEVAGRGLAAAHAAGLVHRDFKPHNVLRSRRGRIVVTDFGLARAALEDPESAGDGATRDVPADAGSLSSTLTATGALLGTPAYMAPEQHDLSAVGPAADQFSFCVSLWEALAGARPFTGETLGELRRHIERGPDPSGEDRIPRRLRGVLRRGLAVDPADRFPSMDALLATLARRRRPLWPIAAGAAIVVAGVIVLATRGSGAPAAVAGCGPVDSELAAFRAAPARAALAGSPDGARAVKELDAYAAEWAAVQHTVCARRGDPDLVKRVTCLRATRTELEVSLAAIGSLPAGDLAAASPIDLVGDPKACDAERPPTRVVVDPAAALPVFREANRADVEARLAAPDPGPGQPCVRMTWLLARLLEFQDREQAGIRADLSTAAETSAKCGDDRLTAYISIIDITIEAGLMSGNADPMLRIQAEVVRAGSDRQIAMVAELLSAMHASIIGDLDQTIELLVKVSTAGRRIGAHGIAAFAESNAGRWLAQRNRPGDAVHAEAMYRSALPTASRRGAARIKRALFFLVYARGDVDEALRIAADVAAHPDDIDVSPPGSIAVSGRLVDEHGAPVADARVVAEGSVSAYPEALAPLAPRDHTAITAADGTFAIPSVPPNSIVMAAIGTRYAFPVVPAARVALHLVPTGAVSGRVVHADALDGVVEVHVDPMPSPLDDVEFVARVAADGSWRIEHVPYGLMRVVVESGIARRDFHFADAVIDRPVTGPLDVDVGGKGMRLFAVVRNQADYALGFAIAWVVRGPFAAKRVGDLSGAPNETHTEGFPRPVDELAPEVRGVVQPGDIAVVAPSVDPGEITVCAIGVVGNFMDPAFRARFDRHVTELELGCMAVTVTTPDQVVVVEVPPMKRLGD